MNVILNNLKIAVLNYYFEYKKPSLETYIVFIITNNVILCQNRNK